MSEKLIKNQNNFLIIAKKGAGKSALSWAWLEAIHAGSQRKAYVYRFPKPEILKKLPFEVQNITNFDALFNINDGCVLIDEAHLIFSSIEKRVNEQLRNLLSISRQNNTSFIMVVHNSFFLNRSLFSFMDVRLIKEVNPNHWELERRYMKKLYEGVHIHGVERFFIDSDYLRGYEMFEKPAWFTEEFSMAYKQDPQKEDFFKNLRTNAPKCEQMHQNANLCDKNAQNMFG